MTTVLHMPSNADFDLALFRLNPSNMMLEFVAESYLDSPEVIQEIVEPGIYFIVAVSFRGTGTFHIASFTTTIGLQNGNNGSISTATATAANNFTVNGAISSP